MDITIGKLVPLTEDLYSSALNVVRECFIDDEPVGKALGVKWTEQLEALWLATFKEGLSFVLVNQDNGDIMGLRLIRRIIRGTIEDSFDVSKFEEGPLKEIVRLLRAGSEQAKFFETYDAKEAFLFLGLGVPKIYRQRGIATLMMKAGLQFFENLGFDSFYVRGGGTSEFSKAIYEKLGFKTLAEIKYDAYCVNGELILKGKTGVHTAMKEYMLFKE